MTDKTFTNAQNVAAIEAIKAAASADRADGKLSKAAASLLDAGVEAKDIARGGQYLAAFQDLAAQVTLTTAQYDVWADTSLAQGKTVNGKRVDTKRGSLVKRVNAFVARVRNKLNAPAPKTGAQGQRRTMDQIIAKQCDAWIKRITENKDKETFNFGDADPVAIREALKQVVAAFKG